jgi:hypothetical protein
MRLEPRAERFERFAPTLLALVEERAEEPEVTLVECWEQR